MHILGIDIGGSGIKGAPVDTATGQLLAERLRLLTPEGARPKAVANTVAELVQTLNWQGAVGVGFPAVVRSGTVYTAANIHKTWIGMPIEHLFSETLQRPVRVINDADAAGLAEMRFGAGKDEKGVVLIVTIGTGLGTALFSNSQLFPNTELGHIELECLDAEIQASDAARKRDRLSWKKWSKRFNKYLRRLEELVWPDLIILGGGAIKNFEDFAPGLTVRARVVPAQFMNEAGIVGAALAAETA
jgi:polyphosphate glucokinase